MYGLLGLDNILVKIQLFENLESAGDKNQNIEKIDFKAFIYKISSWNMIIKEKSIILTHKILAIATNTRATCDWFCDPGSHM